MEPSIATGPQAVRCRVQYLAKGREENLLFTKPSRQAVVPTQYPIQWAFGAFSPRYRWEENIKVDLKEVGWESMEWTDLA
jgi:hypothetical protein